MRNISTLLVLAVTCLGSAAAVDAAEFNVTNPGEFQSALTSAQANGENDIINVGVCSGAGCTGNVYNIATPLTYTAAASEGFSLTIDGFDSDTRILDGGTTVSILRIDTTAASDGAVLVSVRNLTFRQGNALGTPDDGGAVAVLVESAGVEILGSVYEGNSAANNGGALYIRAEGVSEFQITIRDVIFDANGASGDGGAAYVGYAGGVLVDDVDFLNSDAPSGKGGCLVVEGIDPGDIAFRLASAVNILDVLFQGCSAVEGGGAWLAAGSVEFALTGFIQNVASSGEGGGLHLADGWSGLFMVNTGFAGNEALTGGGFYTGTNEGFATITNNTLVDNNATSGDGGNAYMTIGGSSGIARIYNNIIHGGTAAGQGDDIYINNDPFSDIPATVEFSSNDITTLPADGFPDTNDSFFIVSGAELTASSNIDDAPVLNDPLGGDPGQGEFSPTIDAGDNNASGRPDFDWEGDARPIDGDLDGLARVDIGMDEYAPGAVPQADLAVTKTDSPDPVTAGNDVTYAVRVTNNGPDGATGVVVSDTLDPDVTLVSATFEQGTPCTSGGSPVVVSCELGALASGNTATGTIVVTSPIVEVTETIGNTVSVTADQADPDGTDNTAAAQTTVVAPGPAQADLAVTKVASPDPVFSDAGDLVYTITVDNNGPAGATAVTLTDTLPAGVTFVSADTGSGSCGDPDTGGALDCSLGSLADGSNATVTIIVTPDPVTEPTELSNTAVVAAAEEDPVPGNNTATVLTDLNPPSADMAVGVTSVPQAPSIGDTVTYTITVDNDGPSTNTGVTVTVILPSGATFGSATIDQGDCEIANGALICSIGQMAAGTTVTAELTITAPDESGTLTLNVEVSGDADDPAAANDTDEEVTEVIGTVDLRIRGVGGSGASGWPELLLLAFTALLVGARRSSAGFGAFACLAALIALSPAGELQAQTGWYAGGSIGYADADYDEPDLVSDLAARGWVINTPEVDDSDTAWKVYGGFAFNPVLAVEAGYAELGEVMSEFGATVSPSEIDALLGDTYAVHPALGKGWFAAAVLSWPVVPERFSLYARAGAFDWEADIDVRVISGGTGRVSGNESGTDWMYGVGFDWRIGSAWSITAEWERYRLNDWVSVPSVGLRFRF